MTILLCAKIGEKVSKKIVRVKNLDLLAKQLIEREMPLNVSLASKISFAHFFPLGGNTRQRDQALMVEVITVIK